MPLSEGDDSSTGRGFFNLLTGFVVGDLLENPVNMTIAIFILIVIALLFWLVLSKRKKVVQVETKKKKKKSKKDEEEED
jgi:energy-converting hydrogenase Eha subunit H